MSGIFLSLSKPLKFIQGLIKRNRNFSSTKYWDNRYLDGGDSGPGSYGKLSEFKAEILNNFVSLHRVESVVEFGCGDGNQLSLANYPTYVGYDVSAKAIAVCRNNFKDDPTKTFRLMSEYQVDCADLSLSIDVLFHLVEDNVYELYMDRLFSASAQYVAIYSSNFHQVGDDSAAHVYHRKFTDWVVEHMKDWVLISKVPNRYPYNGDYKSTSFCDFYFYEKRG